MKSIIMIYGDLINYSYYTRLNKFGLKVNRPNFVGFFCACKGIILLTQNLRFVSASVSVITLVALCSCKVILILAKGILITESLCIIKLSECSWFVPQNKSKAKPPYLSEEPSVCASRLPGEVSGAVPTDRSWLVLELNLLGRRSHIHGWQLISWSLARTLCEEWRATVTGKNPLGRVVFLGLGIDPAGGEIEGC